MVGFNFGKQKQSSTTTDITPPQFKQIRQPVASALSSFITSGGPGYTGPLAAPVTPLQTSLLEQLASQGQNPLMAQAGNLVSGTLAGDFLNGNPFIDALVGSVQGDLTRQFEDVLVPGLLSRSTLRGQEVQGQGSSAFAREARIAAGEQQRALSDASTKIRAGAYEAERGRQQEAVGQAQALSESDTNRLVQTLQQAALPQLVEDLGIQRGLEEFNRRVTALLAAMGLGVQATAPTPAGFSKGSGMQVGASIFGG